MMSFSDWLGLSGVALVWLLLALRLPYAERLDVPYRLGFTVLGYLVVMFPVNGLSLAGWLRGVTGDFSITTLLLLSCALYARLRPTRWSMRERTALFGFLGVIAVLLYPFALGLGPLDPYRAGYGGVGLILMLALLALWAIRRGLTLLPLAVALALAGWSFGLLESANLWDYLIDAPLAIYALGKTLKAILFHVSWRKHA